MSSRLARFVVALGIGALVSTAPVSQANEKQPGGAPKRPPMPVEAQPVQVDRLLRTVEAVGDLQANEAVTLRPELQGRISAIHFTEGQRVQRGEKLLSLDDAIYRAELAQARASESLSQVEYQRAQKLLRRNAGSETDRDAARAKLAIDRAKVALAQENLARMTLKAPFTGRVGLRQVSSGDFVSPGEALVQVVSSDPIKVNFQVPEAFAPQLKVGQKLQLQVDALPTRNFQGELYAIAPVVDVNGRSLQVRARVPNPNEALRPGMFARVKLVLEEKAQAMLIPEEALVPKGRDQFVFRIVDGKAAWTPVRTGQRRQGQVEVLEGLAPGDLVVTAGQIKIRDGAAVMPINLQQQNAQRGE